MSDVWENYPLQSLVIKVGSGSTPKGGSEAYKEVGTPLIRSMNVVFFGFKRAGLAYIDANQAAQLDNAVVKAGDVLLNITGASIGRVTLAPDEFEGARVNQHVCIIRPNEALDARFLNAYLSSPALQSHIWNDNFGVTRQALTKQQILDFEVPAPPRAEQTRIANQLDTLLARVHACNDRFDAIPALLRRFRQTVLGAAGSCELLATPSKVVFPLIALGAVLAEPLRNGKSVRDGEGLPVLRLTALRAGEINLAEAKTGDWSDVPDVRRFLIRGGDYLVSRGNGSKDLVGRGGLVADCDEDIAFPDTMIRIRPDNTRLLPSYLKYAWASPFVREQIERAAKTTAGIWKLSQPDLENVRFPLPTLESQAEIVRRVEALFALADCIEARCTAARAQAQRLTPLVLAKAFRGELVPQDPNDEPASALLARIGSSDNAAAGKNKRKVPVVFMERAQEAIIL